MGQQQLILLVLATVIVGIAIVVGIRAFTENSIKSNSDAIIHDLVRMANDAQAWKQKPAPFGGQSNADPTVKNAPLNYTGLTSIEQLGYQVNATDDYINLNGTFSLDGAGGAAGVRIEGFNCERGNRAVIVVTGIDDLTINQDETALAIGSHECP